MNFFCEYTRFFNLATNVPFGTPKFAELIYITHKVLGGRGGGGGEVTNEI